VNEQDERQRGMPQETARNQPEQTWWGVTVGSLVYATFAPNREMAVDLTFEAIGAPRTNEVPIFTHIHDSEYQKPLTERFGDGQRAIRLIPFSMNPWPQEPII
jgi:hypothetical protein